MDQKTINKYDSEFCGNLPIHLINLIQSYGALLVVEKNTLKLIQVSMNIERAIQVQPESAVETALGDHMDANSLEIFRQKANSSQSDKMPFLLAFKGGSFMVILHNKPDYHLLEINYDTENTAGGESFIDVYQDLKHAISAIEAADSIAEAAEITARELKLASGFDKVMIYRFDSDWNGNVLAEEKEPEMESYLGFTFPASDIPKQARKLYYRNTYRFIPDRNYTPVRLYPVINPETSAFIDLSDCNLRGVTAVHVEYLGNMGVTASMSTRILCENNLWGLIACHHQTVKKMSYKMCAVFELLSGIISSKISALTKNEKLLVDNYLKGLYANITNQIYRSKNITDPLLKGSTDILQIFSAQGCLILHRGERVRLGNTPSDHDIDDLLLWLNTRQINGIFKSESLSSEYDNALSYKDIASGLLAIPINGHEDEYILLFRPEVVKITNWGGDPSTRLQMESDMKTYHPRFSFSLWREQITGIALPWSSGEIELAEQLRNFIGEHIGPDVRSK